jgi:hypothetical protein
MVRNNRFFFGCILIAVIFSQIAVLGQFAAAQNAQGESIFREQFRLEVGTVRYYVTSLNTGDVWDVNCTALYEGIFYLFMFDRRPAEDFVNRETNQLQDRIYSEAVAYNATPGAVNSTTQENMLVSYITLNYTATHNGLYYLCVAIIENPPDTYLIFSNREMQPYFIPFIPGYPVEWLVGFGIMAFGLSIRKLRSKIHRV